MKHVLFWSVVLAAALIIPGTAAGQGDLDPTNAPGPTMKTLEQLYAQGAQTQQQISSGEAWISGYAHNSSSVNGYTFVSVVNAGTSAVTVTVSFINKDGSLLIATNLLLAAGTSRELGTSSAFSNPVNTGDFDGYCTIESSTGSIKDIIPFAAYLFPTDGSGSIGNPLAISGVNIPFFSRRPDS